MSYTAGGDIRWKNHSGKRFGTFIKILGIHLSCNPVISLLGFMQKIKNICPRKNVYKNFHSMFICNNLNWKQPIAIGK